MKNRNGFTLIECILVLSIFTIVLSVVMGLYLTGYRMYRSIEYQVETEENIRVALNRISETIRRTDQVSKKVKISENQLKIDNHTSYELKNGILREWIDSGVNQLAHNISIFEPSLEDGLLTVRIGGMGYRDNPPFVMEQTFYIGGE